MVTDGEAKLQTEKRRKVAGEGPATWCLKTAPQDVTQPGPADRMHKRPRYVDLTQRRHRCGHSADSARQRQAQAFPGGKRDLG
jgi:hypothetical protein